MKKLERCVYIVIIFVLSFSLFNQETEIVEVEKIVTNTVVKEVIKIQQNISNQKNNENKDISLKIVNSKKKTLNNIEFSLNNSLDNLYEDNELKRDYLKGIDEEAMVIRNTVCIKDNCFYFKELFLGIIEVYQRSIEDDTMPISEDYISQFLSSIASWVKLMNELELAQVEDEYDMMEFFNNITEDNVKAREKSFRYSLSDYFKELKKKGNFDYFNYLGEGSVLEVSNLLLKELYYSNTQREYFHEVKGSSVDDNGCVKEEIFVSYNDEVKKIHEVKDCPKRALVKLKPMRKNVLDDYYEN